MPLPDWSLTIPGSPNTMVFSAPSISLSVLEACVEYTVCFSSSQLACISAGHVGCVNTQGLDWPRGVCRGWQACFVRSSLTRHLDCRLSPPLKIAARSHVEPHAPRVREDRFRGGRACPMLDRGLLPRFHVSWCPINGRTWKMPLKIVERSHVERCHVSTRRGVQSTGGHGRCL